MDQQAFMGVLAGGLHTAPLAAEAQQAGRAWRLGLLPVVAGVMLLLLVNNGCAAEVVRFPSVTPSGTTSVTSVRGHLYRPDGRGPFPAMVLLHGSTGVHPYHLRWAEWLKTEGYVALVVDSFGPRGVSTDSGGLTGERVWDAFGALTYLRSLPFVEKSRVGTMGWSLGGSVALLAGGELFAIDHAIIVNIRGNSYRGKNKLKAGLVHPPRRRGSGTGSPTSDSSA